MKTVRTLLAAVSCLVVLSTAGHAENQKVSVPMIIPTPVEVTMGTGVMPITDGTRIVATDPALGPLAAVLAEEIRLVTQVKPTVVTSGPAKAGDIELLLAEAGEEEAYRLIVGETVKIEARTYQGLAYGTTTLVQALTRTPDGWVLPRMTLADEPAKPYRGVLIDVARRWNSPRALRQVIQLARYYKIRYMPLHLTDDHAWTFPSEAYSKLGEKNRGFRGPAPRKYTREELLGLVKFADDRGVTLVPEIETLGHSDQLRIPYPRVFDKYESDKPAHMGVVDIANPNAYKGLETLIGEAAEIFASSPYIHIGCDEARFGNIKRDSEHFTQFLAERNLKNVRELFCYFVVQLDKYVKATGKQTIIWADGMHHPDRFGPNELPKDVIVTAWQSSKFHAERGRAFSEAGYDVINAVWKPMYQVNLTWGYWDEHEGKKQKDHPFRGDKYQQNYYAPETIYTWSPYTFDQDALDPTPKVIGTQMTVWEAGGEIHLYSLRRPLAAMSERVWNLDPRMPLEEFSRTLEETDKRLDALVTPLEPFERGEVDTPASKEP